MDRIAIPTDINTKKCGGCGYTLSTKGEFHQCENNGVLCIVYNGNLGSIHVSQELRLQFSDTCKTGLGDPFQGQPLHVHSKNKRRRP